MGIFTVQQMRTGFKFNLKAGNGQIIATSKIYRKMEDCLAAIERVKACAGSPVEDQTTVGHETLCPPKFEIRYNDSGAICFYLIDHAGEQVAGGKGYTAKRSCLAGIRSLSENAPLAEVITRV